MKSASQTRGSPLIIVTEGHPLKLLPGTIQQLKLLTGVNTSSQFLRRMADILPNL